MILSQQLLFECLSEEIPSRMQNSSAAQVESYITNAFIKNNVKSTSVEVYVTARRITLFIDGISTLELKDFNSEVLGPKVNAPKRDIDGFLRKNLKIQEDLLVRKINNDSFYCIKRKENRPFFNINCFLKNLLEEMLKNFSWPKSMRWDKRKERWVRPIKNILCILNNEILPISFAGIRACNTTYAHRFLSENKVLTIKTPKGYFELLEKNNVILQSCKRKQFILDQIEKFSKKHNFQLEKNDRLLNELSGLIEWPIVLFGKVKSSELPDEIILSIINEQQKCLVLRQGQKISYFVTVVSVKNSGVIKGYERILEARLADAQFFLSQDKKVNLDYFVKKLSSISFHPSIGSVAEKVKRIIILSKFLAIFIPNASLTKVERAAYLAKADLATSMVKEFPGLQGVIGAHYASHFEEDEEVVEAISEHYKPILAGQECPKSPSAIAVSIADKVDNLVSLIAIGERVSGSCDRFGLRRTAIGLIRTILENNLNIPLKLLIDKSASLYSGNNLGEGDRKINKSNKKQEVSELVFKFCLERFKIILKKRNIKQGIIDSILNKIDVNDLLIAEKQTTVLDYYLKRPEGEIVLSAYKRINNILGKVRKDGTTYSPYYSKEFLTRSDEIMLSNYAIAARRKIEQAIENNNFNVALNELAGFAPSINQFMDTVKINCDSDKLRVNRLSLLVNVISIFDLVARFNLIQTNNS